MHVSQRHRVYLQAVRLRLSGLFLLALASAASGCADDASDLPEEEAVPVLARVSGWTGWTSDGAPPITCDSLISGFEFAGSYSDKVRARCFNTGDTSYKRRWIGPASEENGFVGPDGVTQGPWLECAYADREKNRHVMGAISGIACSGKHCDNVSVQCADADLFLDTEDCYLTEWVSEENGGNLDFKKGYFALSIACSGQYCDAMKAYACKGSQKPPL